MTQRNFIIDSEYKKDMYNSAHLKIIKISIYLSEDNVYFYEHYEVIVHNQSKFRIGYNKYNIILKNKPLT